MAFNLPQSTLQSINFLFLVGAQEQHPATHGNVLTANQKDQGPVEVSHTIQGVCTADQGLEADNFSSCRACEAVTLVAEAS